MSNWIKVITKSGKEMLAGAVQRPVQFTKARCGQGKVNNSSLEEQTGLIQEKGNLKITSIASDENVMKIRLQLNNEEITQSFELNQIGIYASDGSKEALFMIAQTDGGDIIPTYAESQDYINDYIINIAVEQTENITGIIDTAALVTTGNIAEILNRFKPVTKTFTPQFTGISPTSLYTEKKSGKYTRMGNICSVEASYEITSTQGSGYLVGYMNGELSLDNLPFPCGDENAQSFVCSLYVDSQQDLALTNCVTAGLILSKGSTRAKLAVNRFGLYGGGIVPFTPLLFQNSRGEDDSVTSFTFIIKGWYLIEDDTLLTIEI